MKFLVLIPQKFNISLLSILLATFLLNNKFYYKKNLTHSYYFDFYNKLSIEAKKDCFDVKKVQGPLKFLENSNLIKMYFTENAVGKYFIGIPEIALNSVLEKKCLTEDKLKETVSIIDDKILQNIRESIKWREYKNNEHNFSFNYPLVSVNNKWWSNLTDKRSLSDLLTPNQVLSLNNNFYLNSEYDLELDYKTGELIKTEKTFIPEYKEGDRSYPLSWHIIIFDIENEESLDLMIKQRLGLGCSYKSKIETNFPDNYRVEIDGDGKDLGETLCPVNYANYIIYNPLVKKAAFWSLGQECNIGLGFTSDNCFDLKISESFHFFN